MWGKSSTNHLRRCHASAADQMLPPAYPERLSNIDHRRSRKTRRRERGVAWSYQYRPPVRTRENPVPSDVLVPKFIPAKPLRMPAPAEILLVNSASFAAER
jgi:hypothetical protein